MRPKAFGVILMALTLIGSPRAIGFGNSGGVYFQPPCTLVANCTVAFGLHKLNQAYSGNAVRVRRSSDNTTADIGFTSYGDFDVSSFSTFIGNGSGYVAIWYDQSGNGNNATQATNSKQPQLVLKNVNGKPAVYFDSASSQLLTLTSTFSPASYTLFGIGYTVTGSSRVLFLGGSAKEFFGTNAPGATSSFLLRDATDAGLTPTTNIGGGYQIFDAQKSNGTATVWSRGSSIATGSVGAQTWASIAYRAGYSSQYSKGYIADVLAYSSAISTSDRTAIEQYYIKYFGL